MDVPSPSAGTVKDVKVKVGDMVSQGTVVLLLDAADIAPMPAAAPVRAAPAPPALMTGRASETAGGTSMSRGPRLNPSGEASRASVMMAAPEPAIRAAGVSLSGPPPKPGQGEAVNAPPPVVLMPGPAEIVAAVVGGPRSHASPSVRGYARELGVDVSKVKGSGPKNRILKEDIQAYVKAIMTGARPAGAGGLDLPPWPKVDFVRYGSFETKPLSRIKKISGANLARNWVMIPHVTQFDEADITALEAYRVALNQKTKSSASRSRFSRSSSRRWWTRSSSSPRSTARSTATTSSSSTTTTSTFRRRHAQRSGGAGDPRRRPENRCPDIAREAAELAKKRATASFRRARCRAAASRFPALAGIGGTAFAPIVNAPEVAILGVSRAEL